MTLSKWERRRSSREIERTKFEKRIRVVISSDNPDLLNKEVSVEKDTFAGSKCLGWRYSIPIPDNHPIKKTAPYVTFKMRRGIETRELAMMLADVEASDMGYVVINPFSFPHDTE